MNDIMIRLLFFPISVLLQILVVLLYPVIVGYYYIKVKGKDSTVPLTEETVLKRPIKFSPDQLIELGKLDETRDEVFLNDDDNHTAIVHEHLWYLRPDLAEKGLERLVRADGSIVRRYPNETLNYPVSGDCLSSWVHAYMISGVKRPDLVEKVARHYIARAFGLAHYNGLVSARSSNGGVNLVFDGWPAGKAWWPFKHGLMQPALGPQYYTTAGILALAANESKSLLGKLKWNLAYYAHFWLFQGYYFYFYPALHTKEDLLYYTQHITMLNLHTLAKLRSKVYSLPMKFISKDLAPKGNINPFFYALLNDIGELSAQDSQKAIDILVRMPSFNGFIWQDIPDEYNYFDKERPNVNHYSVGAMPLKMLMK